MYDQKPEEPPVQVSSSNPASSAPTGGSSFTSRFEYTDNVQSSEMSSGRVLNHVSPPMSSNFFADYGMESGFTKKSSKSSKVQVSSYSSSYVYCHTRILSFFLKERIGKHCHTRILIELSHEMLMLICVSMRYKESSTTLSLTAILYIGAAVGWVDYILINTKLTAVTTDL